MRWPAVCDRLIDEQQEYFAHAGRKLFEASRQGLKVLAVTSNTRGEGSTTLSICLARAAAATGANIALLDADLTQQQLATGLGLDLAHGWLDVAGGGVPWGEAAVNSLNDRMTVMPLRRLANQAPATVPAGVGGVFDEIAVNYDLLILDLGPLTNEACHLLNRNGVCGVNAAIVVRDMRKTSEGSTLGVAARLRDLGVQAVGIAENYSAARTVAVAA